MIGLTYQDLLQLEPCEAKHHDAVFRLGGRHAWGDRRVTAAEAVAAGLDFKDLVWVASAVAGRDIDVERRLRLWLADCAARVLHVYERDYPGDGRIRGAVLAARQFARGEIDDAAGAVACDAAGGAAYDATWAAAAAAATAAARDAAGDAVRTSTGAAARDAACAAAVAAAWEAAMTAAWATAWAAAWDAAWAGAWDAAWATAGHAARDAAGDAAWDAAMTAAWDSERPWQFGRLVARLSDPEPVDWPLDRTSGATRIVAPA